MTRRERLTTISGTTYLLQNASLPAACLGDGLAPAARTGDILNADVLVREGRIAEIAADLDGRTGAAVPRIDLDRDMLWPAFIDSHTHLDKGHIWPRQANPDGSFDGALNAVLADRAVHWSVEDLRARIEFSLQCAYAHGSRLLRTHLDSDDPLHRRIWPLIDEIRRGWAGRLDLQAVSLVTLDAAGNDTYFNELLDLLERYGGILGAVAFPMPAADALLDRIFTAARQRSLELDFHVDETGDPASNMLHGIARAALRHDFQGRIVCGHCCSLARQSDKEIAETLHLVAEAGIAVVSLPMCNMYLQDRMVGRTPRWRGVTLLHEMAAVGIPVALASDNTRDPFYAYGDLDMLEVYREATRILHLDHPVADWPAAVTRGAADIVGRGDLGRLRPDADADMIWFNARDWTELLSRPQADRLVIRGGRPIEARPPDYRALDAILKG